MSTSVLTSVSLLVRDYTQSKTVSLSNHSIKWFTFILIHFSIKIMYYVRLTDSFLYMFLFFLISTLTYLSLIHAGNEILSLFLEYFLVNRWMSYECSKYMQSLSFKIIWWRTPDPLFYC